ncbi:ESCRT-II domain-containing protein [Rhizoctonia solani AG-1 IA]|uniref:ESCRT-II domain-containing protein n=1 Tax=Thanatephorus cucumeris (strain AG1-IA) TaxID=983506 RepID=L8WZZ5_THACA|nr:ESCRT-II domain-containing protein [Rhizoctonia solani AG-1 IA]
MQTLGTFKTPSGTLTDWLVRLVSLIWSQDIPYQMVYSATESQQPNPTTEASSFEVWSKLITSYGRSKNLFVLRAEDATIKDGSWAEIFINPRIKRGLTERHLELILSRLVSNKLAEFEPPNQTRSVIVYWRKPEEWAEALHDWVSMNLMSILTRHRPSAGESNRPVQHNFDTVRDSEPRHPLSLYGHSSPAPPPCDQHSNHYFSGSVYRGYFRWSYGYCGSILCRAHMMKIPLSSTVRKYRDVSQDLPRGGEVPRHSEWEIIDADGANKKEAKRLYWRDLSYTK